MAKIGNMNSKPWLLKAWKDKRKEILSKITKCQICGGMDRLTIHHDAPLNSMTESDYLSLEKEIMVVCAKCHFKIHRGYRLCPDCGKIWMKSKYDLCWNCNKQAILEGEKQGILEDKEEYEFLLKVEREGLKEEPMVEASLPCGSKITTYKCQAEWGMIESCLHECPDSQIMGDVNNCDAFKEYNNKMNSMAGGEVRKW